jgi:hypothetical protein
MKEEEMMKKEKKNKRMASLLEAGVESAEAETLLDKLESVDDNAFEAMASALAAKKAKPEMKEEKMAKKEKAEELVTEKVLETVEEEASAVDLAIGGSEESQIDSTRAALIDYVYARLGKLQPNKGE